MGFPFGIVSQCLRVCLRLTHGPQRKSGAVVTQDVERKSRHRPRGGRALKSAVEWPSTPLRAFANRLSATRRFERAAALFRAAGDVSRLRLLERLAGGERCVTELAEAAGTGLSSVSQQLRLLRTEHIVTRRRVGKHIYYSLADGHVTDLIRNALEHAAERGEPESTDD
jgi:DNA-binding transcriptional ArsR family regulator